MTARSEEMLAAELRKPGAQVPIIVYLTVTSVSGGNVHVDFDGADYPIPTTRCFGCAGAAPAVGQTVAVHVNGTQLVILGKHL